MAFYFGFIFRPYIKLTYYPMEHCSLQNDKMECHLDPCEANCNHSYNWKEYKKEKEVIIILTNPQYEKKLNEIKNFCNQRSGYCSPMYG